MSIQEFFVRSVHTTEFWVGIALGAIIWLILNTDDITEWWYSNRRKK